MVRQRGQRLWVGLVPDGSLGDYVDGRRDWDVVLFSWSGQFFSTGPWTVDWGASPVDLGPLLSGWSNKAQAHMHEVCKSLRHVSDTWRQDTNPRHWQQGAGAPVSLEVSVLVSWVARGCRNREVVSQGALAVQLPSMVGSQQEEAVRIVVGLSSDEEFSDVCIADTGNGRVGLEDFNFEHAVRRRKVGAEWGLMPETKEYLMQHVQP